MREKFKLLPIYLVYLSVFGLAAFGKLRELPHGAPEWFEKQFGGTILNIFPGALTANFYFIAVLESVVALAFVLSFIRREFLPEKERPVLQYSFLLSQLIFLILGFGLRLTGDFHGAFELFVYFALTFLISRSVELCDQ